MAEEIGSFFPQTIKKVATVIFVQIRFTRRKHLYEGCSIYNETVLITFTFYKVQGHKYYKH